MSSVFRDLLRKVGSGSHTSKDLTRTEAAIATRMMLLQEATPAQIGAFMIAHRIKRPTGEELAGMLDAYDELGPKVAAIDASRPVVVMSHPYDGRDRTLPLTVVTALVLAAAGCPVLQHGGGRMPTKAGVPLVELWQRLGVDWSQQSLSQVHDILQRIGVGFVYLPTHFPLAHSLVQYREEIGKRPPFATLELFWNPYAGDAQVIVGFVHPPTESMARSAFGLRGMTQFTTVKGLEGSCDLPRERTAIIGLSGHVSLPEDVLPVPDAEESPGAAPDFTRLHLHPYDFGFGGRNVPLLDEADAIAQMQSVLRGDPSELRQSVLWNCGFYLWRTGCSRGIQDGVAMAAALLDQGKALRVLQDLQGAIATMPLAAVST